MTFKNNRPCPYEIGQKVSVVHPDKLEKEYDGTINSIIKKSYGYSFVIIPNTPKIVYTGPWPMEWVRECL